jgi:hypothetical protein
VKPVMPRLSRAVVLTAVALTASACGTLQFDSSLAADVAVEPTAAYVYGSFRLVGGHSGMGSIGLHFKCVDGSSFTLGLRSAEDLQVVKVRPTTCSLAATYFTNDTGIKTEKQYTGEFLQRLVFSAGQMHYVGNYKGTRETQLTGYNRFTTYWKITESRDEFEATTKDMQAKWSKLASLKKVNSMVVNGTVASKQTQ